MFVLRQIDKKSRVFNLSLGDQYHFVDKDQEDFSVFADKKGMPDVEKCYAFVVYNNGQDKQQVWPLYEGFYYYVMTESGRTFDNITLR